MQIFINRLYCVYFTHRTIDWFHSAYAQLAPDFQHPIVRYFRPPDNVRSKTMTRAPDTSVGAGPRGGWLLALRRLVVQGASGRSARQASYPVKAHSRPPLVWGATHEAD